MTTVLLIAAALVGVLFIVRSKWSLFSHTHPDAPDGSSSDIPADKEQLYAVGMAPEENERPVMYTLTTCRHCVHLKNFLDEHDIAHDLVYVDDFKGKARASMMTKLRTLNPRGSFPTLVLPGGRVVVGFRENEVREALGLGQ